MPLDEDPVKDERLVDNEPRELLIEVLKSLKSEEQ